MPNISKVQFYESMFYFLKGESRLWRMGGIGEIESIEKMNHQKWRVVRGGVHRCRRVSLQRKSQFASRLENCTIDRVKKCWASNCGECSKVGVPTLQKRYGPKFMVQT